MSKKIKINQNFDIKFHEVGLDLKRLQFNGIIHAILIFSIQ